MDTLITTSSTLLQRKRIFVVIYQFVLKTRFEKCLLISIATTLHCNTNFEKCKKKINFFFWEKKHNWLIDKPTNWGKRQLHFLTLPEKTFSIWHCVLKCDNVYVLLLVHEDRPWPRSALFVQQSNSFQMLYFFPGKNFFFFEKKKKLMGNFYVNDVT